MGTIQRQLERNRGRNRHSQTVEYNTGDLGGTKQSAVSEEEDGDGIHLHQLTEEKTAPGGDGDG
jgi:hypothetical protein